VEAGEDGLPGPVALGEVAPGGTGVQDPEDAVDEGPVVTRWTTDLAAMDPWREQGCDASPLPVGQLRAAQGWPPGKDGPFREIDPSIWYTFVLLPNRA
jgi:hypothetical protein